MIKTNWIEPYNGAGKTNFPTEYANKSGVYFIRRKGQKKIQYIGSSNGNLKKTIYRHFQQWTSKGEQRYERTVYNKQGYEIKVLICPYEQAINIEKKLIVKLQPSGNPIKYSAYTYKPKSLTKVNEQIKEAKTVILEEAPF